MEMQINLFGVELLVIGNYSEEEEETNSNSDFEIIEIYPCMDNIIYEIEICSLLEHHEAKIKELVIEKIEE